MRSILRFLHPTEVNNHPKRLTDLKQYEKDLNLKGITFPIKWKDITKFEKQNPNIPPINVFELNEKDKIYPIRLNNNSCENTIDLF